MEFLNLDLFSVKLSPFPKTHTSPKNFSIAVRKKVGEKKRTPDEQRY